MIWIATLCLLAVIAWLFVNALNERRWVEAHSHDESVAADPGILPDPTAVRAKVHQATGGRLSLEDENSPLSKAVRTTREKSAALGERIERSARGEPTPDDDSLVGRALDTVGGAARRVERKLDERARQNASSADEESPLDRAAARVVQKRDEYGAKLSQKREEYGARLRERVDKARGDRPAGAEEGLLDRVVSKVAGKPAREPGGTSGPAPGRADPSARPATAGTRGGAGAAGTIVDPSGKPLTTDDGRHDP